MSNLLLRPLPYSQRAMLKLVRPQRLIVDSSCRRSFRSLSANETLMGRHHGRQSSFRAQPCRSLNTTSVTHPALPPQVPALKRPSAFRRRLKIAGLVLLSIPFGVMASVGLLLAYDASTYSTKPSTDETSSTRLRPREELPLPTGGPENLPVVSTQQGDGPVRPRLVVVGSGWGAVGLLNGLSVPDASDPASGYDITVISPTNYNLFTPLLPAATVGTVEARSLVQSLRHLIARLSATYISGSVVDVQFTDRLVKVQSKDHLGEDSFFYVPYEKLVIAVGSTTSSHGVPGLEHTHQLKTINDARTIRRKIIDNIETAALPITDAKTRKKLLTFVTCGGGPTGVEFASELYDLINEDLLKYFPKHLRDEVSCHIIQSRDHILNTYASTISEYAEKQFARDEIDVILNARVSRVEPERIYYTQKTGPGGKLEEKFIDTGFVLWSTGIAMCELTRRLAQILPNQYHLKALQVDNHLRIRGAPLGTAYAIGDAATIETNLVDHLMDLVEKYDVDKNDMISESEWSQMSKDIKKEFPLTVPHLDKIRELFNQYDTDGDQSLTINELASLLTHISSKITTLPATAQVASQQGKYLAKKFTKLASHRLALERNEVNDAHGRGGEDEVVSEPFSYKHLGSLAYISNAAAFDFGNGYSFSGGLLAMYLWRSALWSEQCSNRTRLLLLTNWSQSLEDVREVLADHAGSSKRAFWT